MDDRQCPCNGFDLVTNVMNSSTCTCLFIEN